MTSLTIQQAFDLASQRHQAGRLRDAERLYRQILVQQPEHFDAIHRLGMIAHQLGRHAMAADWIRRAIALRPSFAEAHNNLGAALKGNGQLDEAIIAFRRAIALRPNYAGAFSNLGNALRDKGEIAEAVAAFRQAIALDPNYADAYNNLGNALRDQGLADEAIAAYRQAIALRPAYAQAWNNLAVALGDRRQFDESIAAYRQAVALQPDYAEAYSNLAAALREKKEFDEAIVCSRRAIALRPDFAEAHNNLGNALREKGELDEAIGAYRHAISLDRNHADAYSNLGNVLRDRGRFDEAIASCRKAIEIDPDYAAAYNNLGNALRDTCLFDEAIAAYRRAIALTPGSPQSHCNYANALKDVDQLDTAIAAYRQAIALRPDYPEALSNLGTALKDQGLLDEAVAACRQAVACDPSFHEGHSNLLYTLHFHPDYDAPRLLEEHRQWNRRHAEPLRDSWRPFFNDRNPDRRLRIGYVSPDFRHHPVGRFLAPLLDHHDHERFEIFCYCEARRLDSMTARLRGRADAWRNIVGMSDQAAADLIRADRIDILVDLTMHMCHNRLLVFARKPAPVQATYLAYCSTTGLDAIDYRLTDSILDPVAAGEEVPVSRDAQRSATPSAEDALRFASRRTVYSEKSFRLPDVYWCYEPSLATPEVAPLPALATGQVTFGCLNNFAKVSPQALATWIRLLKELPASRLALHARQGEHRQRTLEQLRQEGIDPGRLTFVGFQHGEDYFRQYDRIDIALDPFPYAGGTTTCDALWMGVPAITLAGKTAVGRSGVTLLNSIGLGEWVAQTPEQYVAKAIALASDLPRLAALRGGLRERMLRSPLTDAPRFARGVEAAYRAMWRNWCEKIPAGS